MTKSRIVGLGLCALGLMAATGVFIGDVAAQVSTAADGKAFVRMTPDTIKWVPYPGDGAELGIKQAYIYGDSSKPGLYIIRITFPPGVMSRPHSHPEARIGTVIKGTWYTGTGDKFEPASATAIPTGGVMVHPAGQVHYDGARGEETVVQLMGVGPTGKTMANAKDPGFSKQ